ncbi:hypothetical protein [Parabacteroides sp. An277]|uniref:hypothetical protein n=1 Tax=Parabacteroides sp. An277 TaxID=1965619 RepID=UPI0011249B1C|nr:hypothetical protein [Parabacteroides sp. An277]
MKPLIISFFAGLLVYSLCFDQQEGSKGTEYEFGLGKVQPAYEPHTSALPTPADTSVYFISSSKKI